MSQLLRTFAANPLSAPTSCSAAFTGTTRTPGSLNKAVDAFTQAIVQDPNYVPAFVGLADRYNLMREYTVMPASEAYPRAFAAAKKAVELDDALPKWKRIPPLKVCTMSQLSASYRTEWACRPSRDRVIEPPVEVEQHEDFASGNGSGRRQPRCNPVKTLFTVA